MTDFISNTGKVCKCIFNETCMMLKSLQQPDSLGCYIYRVAKVYTLWCNLTSSVNPLLGVGTTFTHMAWSGVPTCNFKIDNVSLT